MGPITSLEQLCLLQIAKDIKFWCSGVETEGLNGCLYMLGPFDHLGSRQIQELIAILANKKHLKVSYLQSLLHHGITSLDLSLCNYLVSDSLMQMISRRCQKLQHLAIPYCNKRISVQFLQELPANLPSLRSLDLSGCSTCNDNVLMAIGQHCKNIHVLKLRSCKKVTDRGLEFLNMNKSILELNLSGTSCSPDGVFRLLQNHQHLQSLSLETCSSKDHPYFNTKFLSLQKTRLKYLDISNTSVNDSCIANIAKICPEISTLILTTCGEITGESLLHLKSLELLKHLEIHALGINCYVHLREFLIERGTHLEVLHLIMASHIDTGMIGSYCPNLTDLSLSGSTNVLGSFTQLPDQRVTLIEACPHLKKLDIDGTSFSAEKSLQEHFSAIFNKSTNHLEVLNFSDLEDIELDGVEPFVETFSGLKCLDISFCNLVTVDLVMKFVQCCKKLQHLNVLDCWKVHLCDVERAKQIAREQGRELEIVWK